MHPLNYREGDYSSLIPRCKHSVMSTKGDAPGKSSVCEICRSEAKRTVAGKQ
jgi:hypothetical protein